MKYNKSGVIERLIDYFSDKGWSISKIKIVFSVAYTIIGILCVALGLGITYLIGTSDLPDWVKFWLLR